MKKEVMQRTLKDAERFFVWIKEDTMINIPNDFSHIAFYGRYFICVGISEEKCKQFNYSEVESVEVFE